MTFNIQRLGGVTASVQLLSACALPSQHHGGFRQPAASSVTSRSPRHDVLAAYRKLPLAFVPNSGQSDPRVRFSAQAGGAHFWLTSTEVVMAFAREERMHVLRLGFAGGNPHAAIEGTTPGRPTVSYFIGHDPAAWKTALATQAEVTYRALWPRIDMAFNGKNGELKYEFRVAPGGRHGDLLPRVETLGHVPFRHERGILPRRVRQSAPSAARRRLTRTEPRAAALPSTN